MNLKISIITGYGQENKHTIDADEAHKAYYLFLNPEKRGVFKNGLAILGADIRRILPNYQATMGWNDSHQLKDEDWNEIKKSGVDKEMNNVLIMAKSRATPREIEKPLRELIGEPTR